MKTVVPQIASLSEKIATKRAGRLASRPVSARNLLVRCWTKKAPPRQEIKAFLFRPFQRP